MKQFSCGDVVPGCTAKFTYATQEEILEAVAVHASDAHGIREVTPELVSAVSSHIQEVPAS
jgi:predicted small metal-binding protein